jgi:hypothetical protein
MTITINNDTADDLLVTVYDLNIGSAQKILSSEKIDSFASIGPDYGQTKGTFSTAAMIPAW